jgi:hypothetical protein
MTNLQTPKLNFGSKKWILGAISTSYKTADCILLAGRKVLKLLLLLQLFCKRKNPQLKEANTGKRQTDLFQMIIKPV